MTAFPLVELGSLCQFMNGGTPSRKVAQYFEGDIPWITGMDVTSDVITTARHYITEEAIKSSATNIVPKGNILLVTRTGVGKVAIAGVDICISQDFTAVLPDRTKIDERFLFHYLRSRQQYFVGQQRGATIKGVTREVVAKLEVPLPPLPEQRRIAAILDKADAIRRKRQEAVGLVETLLQSAYLEIVGPGPPDFSTWSAFRISELAEPRKNSMRTGPFGSTLRHSEFVESGVAVLGIDNAVQNRFAWAERRFITHEKYEGLKRYTVKPGDVIITIMGTTGRSAVVPDDIPVAISTKHLATITVNREIVHPEYLSNAVHRDPMILRQIRAANRGAIMAGLNLGIIKELELRVPPIEQQHRFAEAIQSVRALEDRLRKTRETEDSLFNSLVQRAFRGEL